MKILLFLIVFTGIGCVKAQVLTTALTSQEWFGGMGGRGIKYVLTVSGNPAELEKLTVKAVCTDGKYFDQFQVSEVFSHNQTSYRNYTFTYTSFTYADKTGPNEPPVCTDNGRVYLEGNMFLMIESRNELPFIAYP